VCLISAIVGARGQGAWGTGSVAPALASESGRSFREVQYDRGRTHWKLKATREERESERSQISQKDFGWRNAGPEERRVRADWKSIRKRAD